jgi:hypothetical protein
LNLRHSNGDADHQHYSEHFGEHNSELEKGARFGHGVSNAEVKSGVLGGQATSVPGRNTFSPAKLLLVRPGIYLRLASLSPSLIASCSVTYLPFFVLP